MKLCKRSHLFVLFVGAMTLLARPSTLRAQLSDIPVRAGLWETHVSTKAGASNIAGTVQACFSAGTTMGDYLTATNKAVAGTKCNISNKISTARAISYDTACDGEGAASKGHVDVHLTDAEHFSGTSHTTVTRPANGKTVSTTIDKTFAAKFLATDCGRVKPLVAPAPPN